MDAAERQPAVFRGIEVGIRALHLSGAYVDPSGKAHRVVEKQEAVGVFRVGDEQGRKRRRIVRGDKSPQVKVAEDVYIVHQEASVLQERLRPAYAASSLQRVVRLA